MPISTNKLNKILSTYHNEPAFKSPEPKFNELTQFISTCIKCTSMTVLPIKLNYASHFEIICPVCNTRKYSHTFEFALSYLKQHIPDSPLIVEHYRNMRANEVTNTVPIIQFVKNYIEFQRTLLGE